MHRPHRAWAVCAGGAIMLFAAMGLGNNLYSVYQPYLIAQNGFTNTQGSWIITTRSIFSVLGMVTAAQMCSRFGVRRTAVAAMVLLALSRFLFGVSATLPGCCCAAALTGLAYSWGGMLPLSLLINRWFRGRQALALGLASAGSGLATIVVPGPVTWLLQNKGLTAAFWTEGSFVLLLALSVLLLVRNAPEELGLEPYQEGEKVQTALSRPAPEGMTPLYWGMFLFGVFLIGGPTAIGVSNMGVLYRTEGFDPETVAALVSCMGIAVMAGKLVYGELVDRLGGRLSNDLLYAVSLLSYVLLCLAPVGGKPTAYAAALMFGLGLPVSTVSFSIWAQDFLGDEGFSKGLKWSQTVYALGIVLLGPVPGWLADRTGSYVPSYALFLGMMTLSAVLIILVYRRTRSGGRPVRP